MHDAAQPLRSQDIQAFERAAHVGAQPVAQPVLEALRSHAVDGVLEGSQVRLAQLLGIERTALQRSLTRLADEGQITMRTSSRGTVIRLCEVDALRVTG